jgi:hypothetical protein
MSGQRSTKMMLAALTILTVLIVAVADVFNATHLFNPNWPGHARFHIGMQFTTLVLVSAVSLSALAGPLTRDRLFIGAMATLSFWPGLLVALIIPGADVYASEELRDVGFPINIALAIAFIAGGLFAVLRGLRGVRATQSD